MEVKVTPTIPAQTKQNVPHFFTISYNRTKIPTRNPATRADYARFITMWATDYPPTEDYPGSVVLQNGVFFQTMDELNAHFARMGSFTIADENGDEV
jgi:hypothetical protein